MRLEVWGLGFGGLGVRGLGVWGLGFGSYGVRFRVWGYGILGKGPLS